MVKFLSSKHQISDILTKPLVSHRFTQLKINLNVWSSSLRLHGRIVATKDEDKIKSKDIAVTDKINSNDNNYNQVDQVYTCC